MSAPLLQQFDHILSPEEMAMLAAKSTKDEKELATCLSMIEDSEERAAFEAEYRRVKGYAGKMDGEEMKALDEKVAGLLRLAEEKKKKKEKEEAAAAAAEAEQAKET